MPPYPMSWAGASPRYGSSHDCPALAYSRMRTAAVGDRHHDDDLVGPWRVRHRDRQRVEVVERPRVVLVAERDVDRRAGSRDFHVRGDQRLATTHRLAHWLAELWMTDRPAVLHLARRADDRGLAVAHRWTTEEIDEPLREHRTDLEADVEQRREVIDESSRKRVLHDDDGRRPVNRGRQGLAAIGHDLFHADDAFANLHGCSPVQGTRRPGCRGRSAVSRPSESKNGVSR